MTPSLADADLLCSRAAKAGRDVHEVGKWSMVYHHAVRSLNDPGKSDRHAWNREMIAKYEPRLRAFIGGKSVKEINGSMGEL